MPQISTNVNATIIYHWGPQFFHHDPNALQILSFSTLNPSNKVIVTKVCSPQHRQAKISVAIIDPEFHENKTKLLTFLH